MCSLYGSDDYCLSYTVIDCGGLTEPDDGQITFTSGVVATIATGLNVVATYTCSEGYRLDGDAVRTCQANGQWDGAEPSCTCEYIMNNLYVWCNTLRHECATVLGYLWYMLQFCCKQARGTSQLSAWFG